MQTQTEIQNFFIPEGFKETFDFVELVEKKGEEWSLVLREKENLIPSGIQSEDAVLNGYMNPVEVVDFPFHGRLVYIKFIRRRWKVRRQNKSYFNQYEFHPIGMKATKRFGDFLKGLDRETLAEFFSTWKNIRLVREENI